MPNKRYAKFPAKGPSPKSPGPKRDNIDPIKTASWPGLPGGTQTKDRSAGIKKMPISVKQEGI